MIAVSRIAGSNERQLKAMRILLAQMGHCLPRCHTCQRRIHSRPSACEAAVSRHNNFDAPVGDGVVLGVCARLSHAGRLDVQRAGELQDSAGRAGQGDLFLILCAYSYHSLSIRF